MSHNNLGSAYLALGKRDAALKQYQQLKSLDPDLASALLRLIYRDRIVDARREPRPPQKSNLQMRDFFYAR
jgi:tetratricopeptide (TPR) repeat protein